MSPRKKLGCALTMSRVADSSFANNVRDRTRVQPKGNYGELCTAVTFPLAGETALAVRLNVAVAVKPLA